MSKKLTSEEFIEKAKKIHGNKYNYSKVEYIDAHTKVCIICPIHGEFWQMPYSHLNGNGCKKCGYDSSSKKVIKSREEFIFEAKNVHGNKYDYSMVKYINNHTKVCIICPIHGEFWQKPNDHLNGHGCPSCSNVAKYTTESFVRKAKEIHGNKYDYSKAVYVNAHTKVCIICPIHGEFWQMPYCHLQGDGCRKCQYSNLKNKFTSRKFIEKAKNIHGDRYDYSKVEYINSKTKVCIICKEHGEFWQTPNHHLRGVGCPSCQNSKLENKTSLLLMLKKIEYINKKHFKWLGKQHLDFFLPRYNIAIECQGIQHFCGWAHDIESLKHIQKWDKKKKQLCEENGIKLYYINYNDDVETKLNEILNT